MRAVNRSSGEGGLTCSFVDKEITQFIQFTKSQGNFSRFKAVPYVGRQSTGEWVLGPKLFLDDAGNLIDEDTCSLKWVGHVVTAPKVAADGSQLPIMLPLGTHSLNKLVSVV